MNCPNCGKEINENQKFCTYCGVNLYEQLQENEENKHSPQRQPNYLAYGTWFLLVVSIILSLLCVFGNKTDIDIPNNDDNSNDTKISAKNCEDSGIKDLVLNIYKENDYYYKYIDPTSINEIVLRSPVATGYDSTIDKYSCKGVVSIKSFQGLKPKSYDYNNDFYALIKTYNYTEDRVPLLHKVIEIKCPVTYSSQISEGSSTVYSSYCGKISSWSSTTEPEIIYDSYEEYIEQPGERARIQKEKREREQHEEQLRQAALKKQQEELKKQQQAEQKRKEEQERYNNSPEGRYNNAQEDLF